MSHDNTVVPDLAAKDRYVRKCGMPESLLVPTAAVDQDAIVRHVGRCCEPVAGTRPGNAFRVIAECGPQKSNLSIWEHKRASILNQPTQVWVHIKYSKYRKSYKTVFPNEDIRKMVIHHIMNRRYAEIHGFRYVRLVPISRTNNSSSAFTENWGVDLTLDGTLRVRTGEASIAYADLTDLMAMLDMPVGGGVMENVRIADALLRPVKE